MTIKEGSFVQVDFTGKDQDGNVFDTTVRKTAQEAQLSTDQHTFEPITVCVGEGMLLPALEQTLIGKKPGDSYTATLDAEDAFGKKRADLLKLMPKKTFDKQQVRIVPGLHVDIDGTRGVIRSITGNRVIVDFNHPLASQCITYDLTVVGEVTDLEAQVNTIVTGVLRFVPPTKIDGTTLDITLPMAFPDVITDRVKEKVTTLTAITDVTFTVPDATQQEAQ